MADIKVMSNIA